MTVIFLQHLISQVCISQQISVIVKIEFAHQITYEAPPRQNIFEGELPAEKSVHEKKVFWNIIDQGLMKMRSKSIQNENDRDDNEPVEKDHHSLDFRIIRLKPDYKICFLQKFFMIVSQIETFVLLR